MAGAGDPKMVACKQEFAISHDERRKLEKLQ
jgi:hypothetical protein